MKLFKKTAALLFCLTLIVGVMAVSASADDEAQLLNGSTGVSTEQNSDFTVMLTKSANQAAILDRDNVQGYEINSNQQVSFDIIMAYSADGAFRGTGTDKTIDGFQFEFNPMHNYGATLVDAMIYKNSSDNNPTHITHPTGNDVEYFGNSQAAYENTYAYSALGTMGSDITLPDSTALSFSYDAATSTETVTGGTKIGTITLAFGGATQAVNIYPQIENLLIHVRDVETLQRPVAATNDSYTGTNADAYSNISGTIDGGKHPQNGGARISAPQSSDFHPCTIRAFIPVIVNPVYTVTLEKFANDSTSGVIAKTAETVTLKYDYTSGSFRTNDAYNDAGAASGAHDTILSNTSPTIYGYTLQGWMVTANDESSTTWKAYTGKKADNTYYNPKWDMNTSYPATSTAMTIKDTSQNAWSTDEWVTTGKVPFTLTTENDMTVAGRHYNTASGVNFIVINNASGTSTDEPQVNSTAFPAGMVGDITLTPVYTRDVYTATFNSGDNNASFGADDISPYAAARVGGNASDTTKPYQYTRQYTIEDLWGRETNEEESVEKHVLDFFTLNDPNVSKTDASDKPSTDPAGPQGLTRKAYKFVGWDAKLTQGSTAPDSAYKWDRTADLDAVAAYNSTQILKEATAKHYGDVTFTAVWEEDIYYAEIGYQYAGTANSLILVVVPKGDNYDANYTYTYNVTNGMPRKMFIVPEGTVSSGVETGQRAAYLAYAKSQTTNLTCDEKITDPKSSSHESGYVMFAYIFTASSDNDKIANINNVKIVEAEGSYVNTITNAADGVVDTKCANYTLKYNGDVDVSGAINVGDFGNVDSLLNADTASVFRITGDSGWYGVRARLEADVFSDDAQTTLEGEALKKFASIADVKTIYNLMGYKAT